jgi:hypothetical protein
MRTEFTVTLILLASSGAGVQAQLSSVVTFDSGKFGWSWGAGPGEWIAPAGGNPGAYLHGELCCLYWPFAFNASSFAGNYRAGGLATLGVDLNVLDGSAGRRVALLLRSHNGTPFLEDDWGAYVLGAPSPGAGWHSHDFVVPAQDTALPAGWSMWHTTAHTWDELIQDVDEVEFIYGDPTLNYVERDWVVGMDNARFSSGEPGRVPPEMVLERVVPGWVDLVWTPPAGCGHPEDYGIYEGEIGDWDSHTAVACTDALDDLRERIPLSDGDRYYLVVPLGSTSEGSYGQDSESNERPPASAGTCRPLRSLTCS